MANRPRRPKTGGRPETILDLEAERVEGGAGSSVAGSDDGETASGETLADPLAPKAEELSTGTTSDASSDAETSSSAADMPGGAAIAGSDGSPDAITTPTASEEDARLPAAASEPAGSDAGETIDPSAGSVLTGGNAERASENGSTMAASPSDETVAEFAREEGFAAGGSPDLDHSASAGPARPRRHLGEFEDDETVLPSSEPEHQEPDPLATSPYRAGHEPEHRGNVFGPLLGAGILGAALALLLGGTALYSGLLPPPPAAEQTAPTQQYAQAGEVQQLSGDLTSLREAVQQLQSAQAAGGAGSGTVSPTEFTQLTDRVAAAERAVQSGGASTGDAAAAAAGATDTANAAREAATNAENAANAARDTAAAAQGAAEEARSGVQASQQAAQNAQTAANEARAALGGFEPRLQAIEEANRRAAVALSAAGLKAAIDRGTPFMAELESFAQASNGGDSVEPLRAFAAGGVPTPSALATEWNEAETQILDTLRPAVSTEDVGNQVLSGLRSLVTVRPAGSAVPADAPGPEAAVARMDAAVTSADYAAWLSEWEGLPDAARQASQSFADRVRARVEADKVIEDTINSAVGASASQG